MATTAEVNALVLKLQNQITELRTEVEALKQQRPQSSNGYTMSAKQKERWAAVAAARDRLKAGETEAAVRSLLAHEYPDLGAEGIIAIAVVQAGKRS